MLINIHSHIAAIGNEIVIQNCSQQFEQVQQPGYYSIGLHPWFIKTSSLDADMEQLKNWSTSNSVLAIGECGLDKICTTDFSLQQIAFRTQIQWANQIQKPLIIHCVKAFDELIHVLQEENNHVPVVIHGFQKSKELALQLSNQGYYLSFGKALEQERIQTVFKHVDLTRILLETDDSTAPIEKIYEWAAKAAGIAEDSLSLQIQKNASIVFGKALNV